MLSMEGKAIGMLMQSHVLHVVSEILAAGEARSDMKEYPLAELLNNFKLDDGLAMELDQLLHSDNRVKIPI